MHSFLGIFTLPLVSAIYIPSLNSLSLRAVSCGATGYDTNTNAYFYTEDKALATVAACGAKCLSDSHCLSFVINTEHHACLHYTVSMNGNFIADPSSPNAFYNRACVVTSSSSSTLTVLSTSRTQASLSTSQTSFSSSTPKYTTTSSTSKTTSATLSTSKTSTSSSIIGWKSRPPRVRTTPTTSSSATSTTTSSSKITTTSITTTSTITTSTTTVSTTTVSITTASTTTASTITASITTTSTFSSSLQATSSTSAGSSTSTGSSTSSTSELPSISSTFIIPTPSSVSVISSTTEAATSSSLVMSLPSSCATNVVQATNAVQVPGFEGCQSITTDWPWKTNIADVAGFDSFISGSGFNNALEGNCAVHFFAVRSPYNETSIHQTLINIDTTTTYTLNFSYFAWYINHEDYGITSFAAYLDDLPIFTIPAMKMSSWYIPVLITGIAPRSATPMLRFVVSTTSTEPGAVAIVYIDNVSFMPEEKRCIGVGSSNGSMGGSSESTSSDIPSLTSTSQQTEEPSSTTNTVTDPANTTPSATDTGLPSADTSLSSIDTTPLPSSSSSSINANPSSTTALSSSCTLIDVIPQATNYIQEPGFENASSRSDPPWQLSSPLSGFVTGFNRALEGNWAAVLFGLCDGSSQGLSQRLDNIETTNTYTLTFFYQYQQYNHMFSDGQTPIVNVYLDDKLVFSAPPAVSNTYISLNVAGIAPPSTKPVLNIALFSPSALDAVTVWDYIHIDKVSFVQENLATSQTLSCTAPTETPITK